MDSELFWNEQRGTLASLHGGTAASRAMVCAAIADAARADVVYFPYNAPALWASNHAQRVLVVDVDDVDRAPHRVRRLPPPNTLLVTRFARSEVHLDLVLNDDLTVDAFDVASCQRTRFAV